MLIICILSRKTSFEPKCTFTIIHKDISSLRQPKNSDGTKRFYFCRKKPISFHHDVITLKTLS